MSQTLMVVLEDAGYKQYPEELNPDCPGADYGNIVARLLKQLDAIATARGAEPLSSYLYTDPELLLPLLDDLVGEARANVARVLDNQQEWHERAEALRTVTSLLEACEDGSSGDTFPELRLGERMEPVLWDLRALRAVLEEGAGRFHLELV